MKINKVHMIKGNNIFFKNATKQDAEFILSLRTDEDKSLFLSKTSNKLQDQIDWLEKYENCNNQIYFIILDNKNNKVGTVRLYDPKGLSFCWGSWIIKNGAPLTASIESALMVYTFALELGFKKAHFDVRKGNKSVSKFHERFGAIKKMENDTDNFYEISYEEIKKSIQRYNKYLPDGITILE